MADSSYDIEKAIAPDNLYLRWSGVVLALAAILLTYFYRRKPRNFPPGPRSLPVVGVGPFLGKHPWKTYRDWSRKYGAVLGIQLGGQNVVVLNDYETINEALVKQKEVFSGRRNRPGFDKIVSFVRQTNDEKWSTMRKFGLNTMRGYGMGKKSMEERVQEEMRFLDAAIQDKDGKPFDIHMVLANAVSNNICNVIFGQRFEYEDEGFKIIMKAFTKLFSDPANVRAMKTIAVNPLFRYLPSVSKNLANFVAAFREVKEFTSDVIVSHKQTFDKDNLRDVIDAFVKEMNENKKHFTDDFLVKLIQTLFIAGTETTTSTLRWGILVLLHYPDEQRKLHQEISSVLGNDGMVSMSHKAELQYTQAFIEELYRFRTLAPLSVDHCTTADVHLRGHFIPNNTMVFPNLWAVHNDPNTFPQPDIFKPERHLDSQRRFVKSRHVIPFSVGPRHCLGEQLARMEVFMFLVNLVQKFEFLPDPETGELPDIENGVSFSGFIPKNFEFVARER